MMIKPASSLCNLSCEYCFYRDVSKHREHLGFGVMDRETAGLLIDRAVEFADGEPMAFAFQGGEPTMAGLDFFRYFVKTVKKKNIKGSPVFYSLQTNGTRLNREWARFFHDNRFLIGLSLDGDYERNRFRRHPSGQNSFNLIIRAADLLTEEKVEFNILTVLTGFAADNGEDIYRFFRDEGFRYIQFIPCLRPFGSKEINELYMTGEQYGNFLIKVFNLYVKDYVRGNYVSVRQFDNWVRSFLGQQTEQCGIMGHCTHQFVSESNGNIYPCDFYCTDEWLLGNIEEKSLAEMVRSQKAVKFIKESLNIPFKCRKCEFFPICRAGGCKRTQASTDYCEAYYRFFSACLPLFSLFRREQQQIIF